MRARATKRDAAEARLFWAGVLALAVGVVTLILALGFMIGASFSGDRSSMTGVYLIFSVVGFAGAALIGMVQHRQNRDPGACRITEERQGSFIGRRRCTTHDVTWDDGGLCPKGIARVEQ